MVTVAGKIILLAEWRKRKQYIKPARDSKNILQELERNLEQIASLSRERGKGYNINEIKKEPSRDRALLEEIKRDLEAIGVY